jgi:hypothetical protein
VEHWEAAARLHVLDLIAKYAHYGDRGKADLIPGLFTEDGVFEMAGAEPVRGAEQIRAFLGTRTDGFTARRARFVRHCVMNTLFESVEPDRVEASSYLLVVTDAGLNKCARYRDTVVCVDGEWLFERRYIRSDADFESADN